MMGRNWGRSRLVSRLLALGVLLFFGVASVCLGEAFQKEREYREYQRLYEGMTRPDRVILVPIFTGHKEVEYEGKKGVILEEEETLEWVVYVPKEGLYHIEMDYYPLPGRSSSIQRELWINGEVPFREARFLTFSRVFGDATAIRRDNRGNELRPRQVETPRVQTQSFRDDTGYFPEPFLFYFHQGENTLSLRGKREPVLLLGLRLLQIPPLATYAEKEAEYQEKGYAVVESVQRTIQGQHAVRKSDPTLYPVFDQGDPTVVPYHPFAIRLNSIGGWRFQSSSQWIAWEVQIPESGLYSIAIKAKQNLSRGTYSSRRLYINGEVPFKEVDAISFPYSNQYKMHSLGEGSTPYLFYLEEGLHEIKLEVVLGDMAKLLLLAEESLFHLSSMYRSILMITSANPDPFRDYQLERRIPSVMENLGVQSEVLLSIAQELEAYTGQRGSNVAVLFDLARQLEDMARRPHTIPKRLGAYRDNIGALGSWIIKAREQPLQIDYLVVSSPSLPLPRAEATRMQRLWHEIQSFVASFVVDFTVVGDVYDGKEQEVLTVWVATGRDQASALKEMIEDSFTLETGIHVHLQLVNMGVLLPATLAGRGPDVALGLPASDPVNYALRNAVVDLSTFPGFSTVASWFMPSALVPFTFREKVYALPEEQPFPMMFYRKDILQELNLKVPETWDELLYLIPTLQKENMNVGLPVAMQRSSQAGSGDIGVATSGAGSLAAHQGLIPFLAMLLQRGGEVYVEDGVATALDAEIAIEAFRDFTDLYQLYNLPLQYDPANRFRIGEMPIVIAPYPLYNQLSVFAPEILGRWDFTLVPGTRQPDGSVDHSCPGFAAGLGYGAAAVMMKDAKNKDHAWEFLSWWVREDTQVRYGRELESLLGPAARYPTANVRAMQSLPWTVGELERLSLQWDYVRGIPEVPGGYMLGRHLDNAFRRVVLLKEEPRKTLLDYIRVIHEEITMKRREFRL